MLPINFNLIILFYNCFFLNEMQHNLIHFFNLSLLSSTLRKRSFFFISFPSFAYYLIASGVTVVGRS